MRATRLRRAAIAVSILTLAALPLTSCLMPNRGTPIYLDGWAGKFWSGKGLLLEVSADQQQCRVAARDRALIVRDLWVDCRYVHPRKASRPGRSRS